MKELETVQSNEALATIVDQLVAKLQRKRQSLAEGNQQQIEQMAGMKVAAMATHLRQSSPVHLKEWFQQRRAIAELLDRRDGGVQPILISHHADEIRRVERGDGNAERPQDYLDSFQRFLLENMNRIPALIVVTQRPRELTRAQLKELKLLLDAQGYSETNLQVAWREMTNEDIAASIIGFVRRAALGDPLVPYGDRVDRAIEKILKSRN